jgi:hypothetical protein
MVIISVSKSKEKAMLKTVSVLLRLLRKAFLVTNRVNVIFETQEREEEYPVITCAAEPRKDKRTQAPLSTMRQPKTNSHERWSCNTSGLASGDRHPVDVTNVTVPLLGNNASAQKKDTPLNQFLWPLQQSCKLVEVLW